MIQSNFIAQFLVAFLVIHTPISVFGKESERGGDVPCRIRPQMVLVGFTQSHLFFPPGVNQAPFEDCVLEGVIRDYLRRFDPTIIRRIYPDFDPAQYFEYDHIPPLDRFFAIHFARDFDVLLVSERISEFRGILFAEPNYIVIPQDRRVLTPPSFSEVPKLNKTLLVDPNDPVFFGQHDQWNLHDDGFGIGCQTAWTYTTGDPDIRIGNLFNNFCQAGWKRIVWNGSDKNGRFAPSGTYFVRIATDISTIVEKITLAK